MAKQGEDQRDQLFDMNIGDGMIEIPDGPVETTEEVNTEEDKGKKPEVETQIHDDGSFEISDYEDPAGSSEDDEFIENDESKETKEKKTPSKAPSESSSSSPYLAFARDRASEGVFLEFEDEDWNTLVERNDGNEADALKELSAISIREMVRLGVEDFKHSVSDEDRALYEAKEKGVPVDEYSVAKRNYEKYSKIKEEDLADDESLQEDVVARGLELRGFSKEEIQEEIDGYKALENLESKAKKALKGIPTHYKGKMTDLEEGVKAQEQARQDGIRQRVARMKRTVDNTPELVPGIKLTKPTREKIMQSMTVPVAKDDEGNPLNPVMATRTKNPDAFEMMIHYYHHLGLFNIDDDGNAKPDFSKITKTAKSKATDEFRSAFESQEKQVTGKARIPKQTEDELDDFEKAFRRL